MKLLNSSDSYMSQSIIMSQSVIFKNNLHLLKEKEKKSPLISILK